MSSLLWLQPFLWVVCRSLSQRTYTLHELQWCIIGKENVLLYLFFFFSRGRERSLFHSKLNISLYVLSVSAWLAYLLNTNLGLLCCPSFIKVCLYPALYLRYGKFFLFDMSSDYFSLTFYTCSNMQEMPAVGCIFYFFSAGFIWSYLFRKWLVCRSWQMKLIIQLLYIDSEVHVSKLNLIQ